MVPIVITLETEEGGSEELLGEVQTEIQSAGEELDVNFAVDTVDRFGTCIKYMHAYYIHTMSYMYKYTSVSIWTYVITFLINDKQDIIENYELAFVPSANLIMLYFWAFYSYLKSWC